MSYPGGPHNQGNVDPFSGEPIPHQYPGTNPGYGAAPPYEQGQFNSSYQGFGAYSPQKPPRGKGPIILVAVLALVVLAGSGVTAFVLLGDDEDPARTSSAGSASPTASGPSASDTATSASSAPATSATGERDVNVDAVTPGWQGVLSPKENVAYDVPDEWEPESEGTVAGFEDESGPRTIMHGVSTYLEDACPKVNGSSRGKVGFMTAGDIAPEKAARAGVILWGEAAAELPEKSGEVEPSAVRDVPIAGGKITAKSSSAVVDLPKGQECPAPKMKITTVAFTPVQGGDTALFIVHTDVGVRGELDDDTAKKIIASLRPYEG